MTKTDTPGDGDESIDLTNEWPPLQDESNETVALALEQRKSEVMEVVERLSGALLNEEPALSDEDVTRLLVLGNDLRGLAAELNGRVPVEQREIEESA